MLTWDQVEELYLKPQRADVAALQVGSGGKSGDGVVRPVDDIPATYAEFAAICRAHGVVDSEERLQQAYVASGGKL